MVRTALVACVSASRALAVRFERVSSLRAASLASRRMRASSAVRVATSTRRAAASWSRSAEEHREEGGADLEGERPLELRGVEPLRRERPAGGADPRDRTGVEEDAVEHQGAVESVASLDGDVVVTDPPAHLAGAAGIDAGQRKTRHELADREVPGRLGTFETGGGDRSHLVAGARDLEGAREGERRRGFGTRGASEQEQGQRQRGDVVAHAISDSERGRPERDGIRTDAENSGAVGGCQRRWGSMAPLSNRIDSEGHTR